MSAQSVSMGSMFSWVGETFKLLRRNATSLLSASGVTLVLGILLIVPMMLVMFASMADAFKGGAMTGAMPMNGHLTMFYVLYGLTVILALLLFPPLFVGWFRLCQEIDQGNTVRALDILKPFRDKAVWLRSVRFALLSFVVYVIIIALFCLAFGSVFSEFMQQVTAQQAAALAGATPAPPHFTAGLVLAYFSLIGVGLLLQFVYMIGFAEVSLHPTSAIEALKLAATGVFKNVLKLVLFLLCVVVISMIALVIVAVVVGLLIAILAFVHKALAASVAIILYILLLLCMYPLMFAGHYVVWKSILGGGNVPARDLESELSA